MSVVESIVKLIADNGIMIVICAIFLYAAFKLINIGVAFLQDKLNADKAKKSHEDRMTLRENVDGQITELLTEYFRVIGGNRIQIMEFSNSVTSVAYLPFKYMTCTYEVTALDIPSTATNISKLPTSLYTKFLKHLYDNLHCIVDLNDPEAVEYSGAFYSLMKENGDECILCSIIKDAKGKALGYISLQDHENKFTDEDILKLDELATKLSSLLGIAEIEK